MDKIIVRGRTTNCNLNVVSRVPVNNEVEIELPAVNFENIKEGDEVWVKAIFDGRFSMGLPKHTIIAHFPQQPTPEPKKEIEELKYNPDNDILTDQHEDIFDKLNEIIRYLNRKE